MSRDEDLKYSLLMLKELKKLIKSKKIVLEGVSRKDGLRDNIVYDMCQSAPDGTFSITFHLRIKDE